MAINVSQAFHRTSANPVDESMALTKAQMLAVNDNLMPVYYFTVCQDDGEIYLYDKTATPSVTTGKFKKFEGGGGGGTDTEIIADDFDPTEPYAVGEYVVYEGVLYKCTTAHTGAWDASDFEDTQVMAEMPTPMPAADMSEIVTPLPSVMSRRFKYSTEEQVVGEWIDGKPVYEKIIDCGALPNAGVKNVLHNISNIDSIVGYDAITTNPSDGTSRFIPIPTGSETVKVIGVSFNKTQITIWTVEDWSAYTKTYVTLRYTKTTD